MTPLHFASKIGYLSSVEYLVTQNATSNIKDMVSILPKSCMRLFHTKAVAFLYLRFLACNFSVQKKMGRNVGKIDHRTELHLLIEFGDHRSL
jgi:hypothetical protein